MQGKADFEMGFRLVTALKMQPTFRLKKPATVHLSLDVRIETDLMIAINFWCPEKHLS
jgi:hypothetical protein